MTDSYAQFGQKLLVTLQSAPFGSLKEQELELGLLQVGIETGLLSKEPATLATTLQLTLTKTNSYLTDCVLRQLPLTDVDAIAELISLLSGSEAVAENKHLSIPLQSVALRIWLERKLANERLHSGESLRHDLVKLTPLGLFRLLDQADDVAKPLDALKALGKITNQPNWLEQAEKSQ